MTQFILHFLSVLNLALTEAQMSRVIGLFEKMVDHVPALLALGTGVLSLCGTVVLIIRQHFNKKEVTGKLDKQDAKLDANTDISVKAFDAANGHNEKIAKAVEVSTKVLEKLADPQPPQGS